MSLIDIMASARAPGSSRICDDTYLLLMLEWLDAAGLVAFDTACQSNRRLTSIWLGVIRGLSDIGAMRGQSYTHFWTRWLIDRGVRTISTV